MEGSTIQNQFEKVQAWHECVRATQIGQRLSCTFDDYFRFHPLLNSDYLWGKIPWSWGKLKEGEGDDRGQDGWMASPTGWTWVWASSWSCWWTGKPGMLQFMGSERVWHNWATEQQHLGLWGEERTGESTPGAALFPKWNHVTRVSNILFFYVFYLGRQEMKMFHCWVWCWL